MSILAISFDAGSVDISVWSSAGEVRGNFPDGLQILNEFGSGSGPVYVLSRSSGEAGRLSGMAVQMDSDYESPTILGVEWGGMVWMGAGSRVYRITSDLVADREIDLGSRFDSFRLLSALDRLVILSETGAFSIHRDGEVDWSADFDIVTEATWGAEELTVSQMDGPVVRVNLKTGNVQAG